MTKIAILGLDENPTAEKIVLEKIKPDVAYILCSDYLLEYMAKEAGFTEPSQAVLEKVADATGTKIVLKKCNVYDPKSVSETMGEILKEIKPADEVIINYSEGSATVKLVLGATAVGLSKYMPNIKILYADAAALLDHTKALKELFKLLYEFF